jgi:hypothetical protein
VITEWLREQNTASVEPPKKEVPSQQGTPTKPPVAQTQSVPSAGPPATKSQWWVAGIALVALGFIAYALRKRRH